MNHTHSEHVHVVIRNTLDKTPTRAAAETGTYFFQLAHCLPGVVSFTTAQPPYPNTAARPNASRHNKSTPVHPGAGLGTAVRPQQQPPRPLPSPESRSGEPGGPAALRAFIRSQRDRYLPSPPSPRPPSAPQPRPRAARGAVGAIQDGGLSAARTHGPAPRARRSPLGLTPPHPAAAPPPGVVQPQRPAGPGRPPREAPSISGPRSQIPAGGAATPRPARDGAAAQVPGGGGSPPDGGGPKAKGKKGVNPEVHPPRRRPHRTARSAAQLFLRPRRSRPPPSIRAGTAAAGGRKPAAAHLRGGEVKELAYLPRAMVAGLSGAAVPQRGGEHQARTRRRAPGGFAFPTSGRTRRSRRGAPRGRQGAGGQAAGRRGPNAASRRSRRRAPARCPPPSSGRAPGGYARGRSRAARAAGGAGRGGGLRAPQSRLRPRPGAEAGRAVGLLSLECCH